MKIERVLVRTVEFGRLEAGTVFKELEPDEGKGYYIKMREQCRAVVRDCCKMFYINAVNLETGGIRYFLEEEEVIPVDAKLSID